MKRKTQVIASCMIWLGVLGDGIQMGAVLSYLSYENDVLRLAFSLISIDVSERKRLPAFESRENVS
jgi:hypothetical protein